MITGWPPRVISIGALRPRTPPPRPLPGGVQRQRPARGAAARSSTSSAVHGHAPHAAQTAFIAPPPARLGRARPSTRHPGDCPMTTTPIHSSHDRLVVCLDGDITPHGAREFVLAVDQRLERDFCEHLEVVVASPGASPAALEPMVRAFARWRAAGVDVRAWVIVRAINASAMERARTTARALSEPAPSARGGCGASNAAVSCRFRRFECRPGRQRRTARLEPTVSGCATTRNHTGDGPKIGPGRPRLGGRSWAGLRPRVSRRCSSAGSSSAFAPRGDATPNGDKERAPAEREHRNPPTMR